MPRSIPRAPSFLLIGFGYVVALGVAFAVTRSLGPSAHPLWAVAAADAAATLAVFVFSVLCDNSSVYDPYWSAAPIAIAPYIALRPEAASAPLARKILVCALVALWGIRLTYNWARGFTGMAHEDWRYADLRKKTGPAYWVVSLLGLHFMPTVMVYLGCFALLPALTGTAPLGPLDAVAAIVTFGAVAIEALADEQLARFRREKKKAGEIMARGLWAYSRHPNYFGEVTFWWGLFLFGVAAAGLVPWTVTGAVAITLLFVFISIPMIDRRSVERRPAYADHMKRVSALVPWFPKRTSS